MLMRSDPFRDFDRIFEQTWNQASRSSMPMDAYRHGDAFVVHLDLPGVDPASIDLGVEQNVLTVRAERHWQAVEGDEVVANERPQGEFRRQLFLGNALNSDDIHASYEHGVLTLTIPVAERAKPRRIEVSTGAPAQEISTTAT
jgi:HSP20 family protein